jgi:hypothetical protein
MIDAIILKLRGAAEHASQEEESLADATRITGDDLNPKDGVDEFFDLSTDDPFMLDIRDDVEELTCCICGCPADEEVKD